MKPVAITGIGLVHPHGTSFDALVEAVGLGTPPPRSTVEDLDYKAHFPDTSKRIKKMDQVGRFASCAALFALRHAGLERPPDPPRAGLATGTMFGGLEACVAFDHELHTVGPDHLNPVHFPNTAHNVACGHVAIALELKGPVLALASGLVAGHEAVVAGLRALRAGRADLMVVGGFDRWIPEIEDGLRARGLLEQGLRPAEGACFLVLEDEARAVARGARIHARLLGYGMASDPVPLGSFVRQGKALARALARAQQASGSPEIRLAVLGLQGVPSYDGAIETGCETALGRRAAEVERFVPKAVLGETFGSAGPFAIAALVAGWQGGTLPRGPALIEGTGWGGAAVGLVAVP